MLLQASATFDMHTEFASPTIFLLTPQSGSAQTITQEVFTTTPQVPWKDYTDGYGNLCRRLVIPAGNFSLHTSVTAVCEANIDVHPDAWYTPIELLPDYVLQYLLPSRYCESDKFTALAAEITYGLPPGYAQVDAIRQWVHTNFHRQYGTTNSSTSAWDVLQTKTGVCRDFTHVAISLCRSMDIPTRMVAGYLHQLEPMDLHAWFEAYVGNRWYTFDAIMPTPVGGRIIMAYGRDAADIAFASHFGYVTLNTMEIAVKQLAED